MVLKNTKIKTIKNTLPYTLKPLTSSKGKSKVITVFKNSLPLNFKFKKLTSPKVSKSGRSSSGHKILYSRGRVLRKKTNLSINYSFRSRYLNFIAGFYFIPFKNKIMSLIYLSSGVVQYVPTTINHRLFLISKFYAHVSRKISYYIRNTILTPNTVIYQNFYIIKQLPKNKPISLIEILPHQGVQYIRSSGSSGFITKMDSRTNISLVTLPSGIKKMASIYSIGSVGNVALTEKKKFKNNKAGFSVTHGKKPKVRGVAMNPVDHPHGGRTKAIRYQRTP